MSTEGEQRSGSVFTVALWMGTIASGIVALWSSRTYYDNRFNVGWGDSSADQYQKMLWWSTSVSVGVFLVALTLLLIRSKNLRLAFIPAVAVCGVAMLVGRLTHFPLLSLVLLPGLFAAIVFFGLHSDLSTPLQIGWIYGISTAFYTAIGMLAVALNRLRGRTHI